MDPLPSDDGNSDASIRPNHSKAIARLMKSKELLDPTVEADMIHLIDTSIQERKTAIIQLKPLSLQLESLQSALQRKKDKLLALELQISQLQITATTYEQEIASLESQELQMKDALKQELIQESGAVPVINEKDNRLNILSDQILRLQTQALQAETIAAAQNSLHAKAAARAASQDAYILTIKQSIETITSAAHMPEEVKTTLNAVLIAASAAQPASPVPIFPDSEQVGQSREHSSPSSRSIFYKPVAQPLTPQARVAPYGDQTASQNVENTAEESPLLDVTAAHVNIAPINNKEYPALSGQPSTPPLAHMTGAH